MDWEERARLAVFEHLAALVEQFGDVLPRTTLQGGLVFDGEPAG